MLMPMLKKEEKELSRGDAVVHQHVQFSTKATAIALAYYDKLNCPSADILKIAVAGDPVALAPKVWRRS